MTFTDELMFVSGQSTESVTVPVAEKGSALKLISSDLDQKTGVAIANYTITTSEPGYVSTLRVKIEPVSGKMRRIAVTFSTWLQRTSDLSDDIIWWPVEATMSFMVPILSPLTVADFDKLAGVAYSYTALSVAAGVRDTSWIASLLAGAPAIK